MNSYNPSFHPMEQRILPASIVEVPVNENQPTEETAIVEEIDTYAEEVGHKLSHLLSESGEGGVSEELNYEVIETMDGGTQVKVHLNATAGALKEEMTGQEKTIDENGDVSVGVIMFEGKFRVAIVTFGEGAEQQTFILNLEAKGAQKTTSVQALKEEEATENELEGLEDADEKREEAAEEGEEGIEGALERAREMLIERNEELLKIAEEEAQKSDEELRAFFRECQNGAGEFEVHQEHHRHHILHHTHNHDDHEENPFGIGKGEGEHSMGPKAGSKDKEDGRGENPFGIGKDEGKQKIEPKAESKAKQQGQDAVPSQSKESKIQRRDDGKNHHGYEKHSMEKLMNQWEPEVYSRITQETLQEIFREDATDNELFMAL